MNFAVRHSGLREIHDKVAAQERISEEDALRLFESKDLNAVGAIADFDPTGADILVALHACDTATDDALYKGIQAGSQIIVAAPCCHKEVRKQIKPPAGMKTFLKHGTLLETTAEVVTDGLRSLLLERSGYNTKVFEFVSPEHTPKNNMIAAVKAARPVDRDRLNAEIAAVKSLYSIERQRLEHLLA